MPGGWGNSMTVKTTSSTGGISYYKNFVSKVLSVFPRSVINGGQGSNVLGSSITCQDYSVKAGDSLWGIAASYFGSGAKYESIMSANHLNNTLLHVGQTLKVGC
jgi:LysM repeat protein